MLENFPIFERIMPPSPVEIVLFPKKLKVAALPKPQRVALAIAIASAQSSIRRRLSFFKSALHPYHTVDRKDAGKIALVLSEIGFPLPPSIQESLSRFHNTVLHCNKNCIYSSSKSTSGTITSSPLPMPRSEVQMQSNCTIRYS